MFGSERARTLEERLRDYGEELCRIFCTVDIEHSWNSSFSSGAQGRKFPTHYSRPRAVLSLCRKRRRAIGRVVFEVELMREFVQDKVTTICRIGRAAPGVVPG